jgi:hypothetical protein
MNAMKRTTARTILASLALATVSVTAFAHGGHGAEGTHLHATDAFGLLALALGAAWWLNRRGGGK